MASVLSLRGAVDYEPQTLTFAPYMFYQLEDLLWTSRIEFSQCYDR